MKKLERFGKCWKILGNFGKFVGFVCEHVVMFFGGLFWVLFFGYFGFIFGFYFGLLFWDPKGICFVFFWEYVVFFLHFFVIISFEIFCGMGVFLLFHALVLLFCDEIVILDESSSK